MSSEDLSSMEARMSRVASVLALLLILQAPVNSEAGTSAQGSSSSVTVGVNAASSSSASGNDPQRTSSSVTVGVSAASGSSASGSDPQGTGSSVAGSATEASGNSTTTEYSSNSTTGYNMGEEVRITWLPISIFMLTALLLAGF
ncbi:hypothetical protein C0Q70_14497 [Pomacea canaliculata]|uniref:Uncharacterized protein n=1 Tax=Pomacea canaliculata TaxID=400727 RepID=A0A2T7NS97_POMCA|nr:hypothetical protein C0Q70_14497 [Pomacea canaliculata]